jgi:hypothetical protein
MNASDPGERSTRLERELREILERADSPSLPVESVRAVVRRQRASARAQLAIGARQRWLPRNWPQDLSRLGAALVLAIAAAAIAEAFRFGALVLAIASAIAFFSLWAQPRTSNLSGPTRWRGRDLNDRDRPPSFDPGRLLRWRGPKGPFR